MSDLDNRGVTHVLERLQSVKSASPQGLLLAAKIKRLMLKVQKALAAQVTTHTEI